MHCNDAVTLTDEISNVQNCLHKDLNKKDMHKQNFVLGNVKKLPGI